MPTFDKIEKIQQSMDFTDVREEITKCRLVGEPLHASTNYIERFLSRTIGLEDVIVWRGRKKLPQKKLKLPTISYFLDKTYKQIDPSRPTQDSYKSGYGTDKLLYWINWTNSPLITLNYLSRLLGKMIGSLLVSPWTIPAYLGVRIYYGIRKKIDPRRFKKALRKVDKVEFAKAWLNAPDSSIDLGTIVENVPLDDFFTACVADIFEEKARGVYAMDLTSWDAYVERSYPDKRLYLPPMEHELAEKVRTYREILVKVALSSDSGVLLEIGQYAHDLQLHKVALIILAHVPGAPLEPSDVDSSLPLVRPGVVVQQGRSQSIGDEEDGARLLGDKQGEQADEGEQADDVKPKQR